MHCYLEQHDIFPYRPICAYVGAYVASAKVDVYTSTILTDRWDDRKVRHIFTKTSIILSFISRNSTKALKDSTVWVQDTGIPGV